MAEVSSQENSSPENSSQKIRRMENSSHLFVTISIPPQKHSPFPFLRQIASSQKRSTSISPYQHSNRKSLLNRPPQPYLPNLKHRPPLPDQPFPNQKSPSRLSFQQFPIKSPDSASVSQFRTKTHQFVPFSTIANSKATFHRKFSCDEFSATNFPATNFLFTYYHTVDRSVIQ